jgi:ribA/ribD-fused uncharacterized protein
MIDKFDGEYRFLSNFFPSVIVYQEKTYKTVEHAFQAAKAKFPKDAKKIQEADSPGQAKRLGRKCVMRDDWEQIKFVVMLDCLREKFKIPELRMKLKATGDQELVEGNNWHDGIFGSCTCDKCKHIQGRNMLGKLLMQVRSEILENK